MSKAEFFVGNFMKEQKNNKVDDLTIDAIAEQWVDLVLAHIEANKQKLNASANKNKEEAN